MTLKLYVTHADNLSIKEIVECMSNVFRTVYADRAMDLPLGVGRVSKFHETVSSAHTGPQISTSSSSTSLRRAETTITRKRYSDGDIDLDRDDLTHHRRPSFAVASPSYMMPSSDFDLNTTSSHCFESSTPVTQNSSTELKQCSACDEFNLVRSVYCGHCTKEF